ncbi:MAG: peptidase [Rhizobiales bacterium]|nr:peptidase [Hyphomicrobiales bacterium]MBA69707.1 peptidase [Hyphomicrobiales bacterium]
MAGRAILASSLVLPFIAQPAQAQQGRVAVIRDAEIETLLKDYVVPILKAAGLSRRGIEIVLVNDPSFNAFVAGRRIFINTGAIQSAETPNEIIGVLAHETGHLAGGHQQRLREQMERARTMAIVGSLLGIGAMAAGSVAGSRNGTSAGGALVSAAPGIAMRGLLSYRRSEEMNADQAAVKYLRATKQSAKGMLTTFERFSTSLALAGVQVDPYQISHPLPRERIAMLETLAHESPYFDKADSAALLQRHQLARAKIAAFSGGQPAVARIFGRDRSSLAGRYGDAIATDLSGNSRAALGKMDDLIKAAPNNAYFHEFRGEILLKLRRPVDAANAFARAMKLADDSSGLIRSRYAFALLSTGEPANARKSVDNFRAAIQSDPDNINAYLHLSQAYGLSGDIGNADLAMAEGHFRAGSMREAQVFAARALQRLPKGTPGARRANDILSVAK